MGRPFFLGPCGSDAALAGWATLAEKTHPIIHSQLHGLRAMGNPRRPSAFALTLSQGHEETVKLMAHWRGPIYRAANVAPDERPPLPHITVARPPRKASAAIRQMGKDWIQNQPVPTSELKLDGIALYTWSEDRQERLFQIVHQRPLLGK